MSRSPYGSATPDRYNSYNSYSQRPTLTGMLSMGAPAITDHEQLLNRDAPNAHPMSSITNLETTLESKLESAGFITEDEILEIINS